MLGATPRSPDRQKGRERVKARREKEREREGRELFGSSPWSPDSHRGRVSKGGGSCLSQSWSPKPQYM
jgi:hypothetical protein